MLSKILIIGAGGQIGSELTLKLRDMYGEDAVIASDINTNNEDLVNSGPFEFLNAEDFEAIKLCCKKHSVKTVYLLAALLSATAEQHPMKAWELNTKSLFNVLNLAKEGLISSVFFPSSIAVYGPTTPKKNTPQHTILEPSTVYGMTKLIGERWCEYYYKNYNVDVRSLRYPGLISWKTLPGGGTTDYANAIFYEALSHGKYECYLKEDTVLPMMYIEDAIDATIKLMTTDTKAITIRSSYNLSAISFSPKDIAKSIQQYIPKFKISYNPDFRQAIADSWNTSIDDSYAQNDWGWQHNYNLERITKEMITNLNKQEKEQTGELLNF